MARVTLCVRATLPLRAGYRKESPPREHGGEAHWKGPLGYVHRTPILAHHIAQVFAHGEIPELAKDIWAALASPV